MECSVCHSQDTKFVSGVSKAKGTPWTGYDCADCTQPNGRPTRTFAPRAKGAPQAYNAQKQAYPTTLQMNQPPSNNSLEKKVDLILDILKREFPNANDDVEVPF